jgi:hypothetical protein
MRKTFARIWMGLLAVVAVLLICHTFLELLTFCGVVFGFFAVAVITMWALEEWL